MIDLDALRKPDACPGPRREQNLALLNHYFWLRSSRADRHRFFESYLENRARPGPEARRFAQAIEDSTRAWAERLWRRWGRRCRFTNKYFQVRRQWHAWCVAVRDLEPGVVPRAAGRPRCSRSLVPTPSCSRTRGPLPCGNHDDGGGRTFASRSTSGSTARNGSTRCSPIPPLARLAVVASRPAPGKPRHPHAAQPRLPRAHGRVWANPLSWFLPRTRRI